MVPYRGPPCRHRAPAAAQAHAHDLHTDSTTQLANQQQTQHSHKCTHEGSEQQRGDSLHATRIDRRAGLKQLLHSGHITAHNYMLEGTDRAKQMHGRTLRRRRSTAPATTGRCRRSCRSRIGSYQDNRHTHRQTDKQTNTDAVSMLGQTGGTMFEDIQAAFELRVTERIGGRNDALQLHAHGQRNTKLQTLACTTDRHTRARVLEQRAMH